MDFGAWLVRQHYLTKKEYLTLAWESVKGLDGKTVHDYLEPSLREYHGVSELRKLRALPLGDVLEKKRPDILADILNRCDSENLRELVTQWQRWHVEHGQPISDFCLGVPGCRSFGRRMYEYELEKIATGEYVAQNIVHDSDHVIIPEGTSTFWAGLAVLRHHKNMTIITSNGALVRELQENPELRARTEEVVIVGGVMDVDEHDGGAASRGFVGTHATDNFNEMFKKPGATVLISSVNGFLPDKGPFAPQCFAVHSTRYELLKQAFASNIRGVVFVSDYTKMRADHVSNYGDPIFNQPGEWRNLLGIHGERRVAIVTAPPPDLAEHPELLIDRPSMRPPIGVAYSRPLKEYLAVAKELDQLLPEKTTTTGLIEVGVSGAEIGAVTI